MAEKYKNRLIGSQVLLTICCIVPFTIIMVIGIVLTQIFVWIGGEAKRR